MTTWWNQILHNLFLAVTFSSIPFPQPWQFVWRCVYSLQNFLDIFVRNSIKRYCHFCPRFFELYRNSAKYCWCLCFYNHISAVKESSISTTTAPHFTKLNWMSSWFTTKSASPYSWINNATVGLDAHVLVSCEDTITSVPVHSTSTSQRQSPSFSLPSSSGSSLDSLQTPPNYLIQLPISPSASALSYPDSCEEGILFTTVTSTATSQQTRSVSPSYFCQHMVKVDLSNEN